MAFKIILLISKILIHLEVMCKVEEQVQNLD